ncbi:UDP-N-acetylmuramoyl-tripeptide--D-alanyl-D-alanine ligase [Robiginitalea sp. SC105]|uniref:UDP-N-acetylmuramoyl-tripeptide--D-alanyl-D- alanine ligase n=1 Tax=Robiginitalea sp. SC105 TaxID=2762332 RepID=UPI001639B281|nr:UDP-N-acetylmuramoyl-tripeptide--D-alanyl-D-alanine ligase [Robiginitalea sp. SC105]MBC2839571.1 UDP-N-acetylmuramoyl-tripeptide--D-alanyl-D-alanine ligase [Robiginitalea sp. SC105]
MTTEALHALFLKHPKVSTDSRSIPENGIFFALKGPNFNGNDFAIEALAKGAAFSVVDEDFPGEPRCIRVADTLTALQQLATHHRMHSKARIIGLTGSNGKTTTKELIAAVLSKKFRTLATRGNLNNHIGVPLTLLRITRETEMAVIEMGANHQGEIGFLSEIARPDYGYITNFGKAHLEGFGGVEGVVKGKTELYRFLMENGGTVFMNADDPIQVEKLGEYGNQAGFSITNPAFEVIRNLTGGSTVSLEVRGREIHTGLIGNYNFTNCAAAAFIGTYFGVPLEGIAEALEAYRSENNRSQMLERGQLRIVLDAYNANPTSMAAALEHFAALDAPRKIIILGDMFELGADAATEHEKIAQLALQQRPDQLYLVGRNFYETGLPVSRYPDFESLVSELKARPIEAPATLLIKGSRGMALERVLEVL